MKKEDMREFLDLILDYYEKLDKAAPLEAFEPLIDWESFRMVNGELVIDGPDAYASWYKEVNGTLLNRRHSIERLAMEELGEGEYEARMDMHFQADTRDPYSGETGSTEVRGKILWHVKRPEAAGPLRLSRYMVSV